MKLSLITTISALLTTATAVGGYAIDGARSWPQHPTTMKAHRSLDIGEVFNFFLVSHISQSKAWCITAAAGTTNFGNLLLRPCDFESGPLNQLWYPGEGGQIHSTLDDEKCIAINHGVDLFPSARARLADCSTNLTDFDYEDGQFKIGSDNSFCLTNRGPNPHRTDFIHAKKCIDRKDFYWEPVPHIPFFAQLKSGGGCAQPRIESSRIFLDPCEEELAWRIEIFGEGDENALLHSALDDSLCLRAGRGELAIDGTQMTVEPCDRDDSLQQFQLGAVEDTIHVANNFELCMVYRGIFPHVGSDPIIMKTCAPSQELWDIIDLFPFPI